jgi:hypothetical protein
MIEIQIQNRIFEAPEHNLKTNKSENSEISQHVKQSSSKFILVKPLC